MAAWLRCSETVFYTTNLVTEGGRVFCVKAMDPVISDQEREDAARNNGLSSMSIQRLEEAVANAVGEGNLARICLSNTESFIKEAQLENQTVWLEETQCLGFEEATDRVVRFEICFGYPVGASENDESKN